MRSHRSTGVFPAYIKKIRYNFLLAEETRNRTPLNGMLRSDDKVTNSFRKITKEANKCLGKKTNDDCIIKAYVYKKAGFNKFFVSYIK